MSENFSSGAGIQKYIDEVTGELRKGIDDRLSKLNDELDEKIGQPLDHRMDIRIERARTDINEKVSEFRSELKEHATKLSESARNQAIGVLAFAALLLTIGGALGINKLIGDAIKDSGVTTAIDEAEAARDRAVAAAQTAEDAVNEIKNSLPRVNAVPEQIQAFEASFAERVKELQDEISSVQTAPSTPTLQVVRKPYTCSQATNEQPISCPDGFKNTGAVFYDTYPGGQCGQGSVFNLCFK